MSIYESLRSSLEGTDEELARLRAAVEDTSRDTARDSAGGVQSTSKLTTKFLRLLMIDDQLKLSPDIPPVVTSLSHPKLLLLVALRLCHEREDKEIVEEGISLGRELVQECEADLSDELMLVANSELAYFLGRRCDRVEDVDLYDKLIKLRRRIVDAELLSSVFDERERGYLITRLAYNYQSRFALSGRREDIDDAVAFRYKYAQLAGTGKFWSQARLGDTLRVRYERFLDSQDKDDAIAAYRAAISVFSPTSASTQADAYTDLAKTYETCFALLGEEKDIDDCLDARHKAIKTASPDTSDMSRLFHLLGWTYSMRFNRYGKFEDIEQAVESFRHAAELCGRSHDDYPLRLYNLSAASLKNAYVTSPLRYIDEAITLLRQTQSLVSHSSPLFINSCQALGTAFRDRFSAEGQRADIDAAIEVLEGAMRSQPILDKPSSNLIYHLGDLYRRRSGEYGGDEDREKAVAILRRALEMMRSEGTAIYDLGWTLINLGEALLSQSENKRELRDIDEAIQLIDEAVTLTASDKNLNATCFANLGRSYTARYSHTQDTADLEGALRAFRTASESASGSDIALQFDMVNGLGNVLKEQYRQTGCEAARSDAIRLYKSMSKFEKQYPDACLFFLLTAGEMEQEAGEMEAAFCSYKRAMELLPRVAWVGQSASSQLSRLSRYSQIQTLPSNAAAVCMLLAEQIPEKEQYYLGKALCLLDQGRSVMWSQASSVRAEVQDLREVQPGLADELERTTRSLRSGMFDVARQSDEMENQKCRRAGERFEELVGEVQQQKGFEQFLLPPSVAEIQDSAREGPIIVVNASEMRCDAVIVESGKPLRVVPLTQLTLKTATDLTSEFSTNINSFQVCRPQTMNALMNKIWMLIGHPVLKALGLLDQQWEVLPRVWWCMTGQLTFLPIHACFPAPRKAGLTSSRATRAARTEAGMMELVVSSYTPTISALLRSRSQQSNTLTAHRDSHIQNIILIVAQPNEVPGGEALPEAKHEAEALTHLIIARSRAQAIVLVDAEATTATVPAQIATCSWAHFSCHAVQDAEKPMESAFLMSDGRLTLEKLLDTATTRAQFAFLSACQSAKGDNKLPDESVHIAAGMQVVGFPSVIGTMWAINDKDGRFVAERFYESVYEGHEETVDVGRALHNAIQQLRTQQVPVSRWMQFIHLGVGKIERI